MDVRKISNSQKVALGVGAAGAFAITALALVALFRPPFLGQVLKTPKVSMITAAVSGGVALSMAGMLIYVIRKRKILVNELKNDARALGEQIGVEKNSIQTLESSLSGEQTTEQLQKDLDERKTAIQTLRGSLAKLQTKRGQLLNPPADQANENYETEIKALDERLNEIQTRIDQKQLANQIHAETYSIQTLENSLSGAQTTEQLQKDLDERKTAIQILRGSLAKLQTKRGQLPNPPADRANENYETEINNLQNRLFRIEGVLDILLSPVVSEYCEQNLIPRNWLITVSPPYETEIASREFRRIDSTPIQIEARRPPLLGRDNFQELAGYPLLTQNDLQLESLALREKKPDSRKTLKNEIKSFETELHRFIIQKYKTIYFGSELELLKNFQDEQIERYHDTIIKQMLDVEKTHNTSLKQRIPRTGVQRLIFPNPNWEDDYQAMIIQLIEADEKSIDFDKLMLDAYRIFEKVSTKQAELKAFFDLFAFSQKPDLLISHPDCITNLAAIFHAFGDDHADRAWNRLRRQFSEKIIDFATTNRIPDQGNEEIKRKIGINLCDIYAICQAFDICSSENGTIQQKAEALQTIDRLLPTKPEQPQKWYAHLKITTKAEDFIYWTQQGEGQIVRVPFHWGEAGALLAARQINRCLESIKVKLGFDELPQVEIDGLEDFTPEQIATLERGEGATSTDIRNGEDVATRALAEQLHEQLNRIVYSEEIQALARQHGLEHLLDGRQTDEATIRAIIDAL